MSDEKEPLSEEQLAEWSRGRFVAGQHEAAYNIQSRYEAVVKAKHAGSEIEFVRDDKTGELSYKVLKTQEQLEAEELQRMEAEEEEEKRLEQEGKKKGAKK